MGHSFFFFFLSTLTLFTQILPPELWSYYGRHDAVCLRRTAAVTEIKLEMKTIC